MWVSFKVSRFIAPEELMGFLQIGSRQPMQLQKTSAFGAFFIYVVCIEDPRVCVQYMLRMVLRVLNTLLFNGVISNSKWKADKHGVTCVRLGPKGNTLLSAGRNIKLWDLETKETLKVRNKSVDYNVSFEIKQNKLLGCVGEKVNTVYNVPST